MAMKLGTNAPRLRYGHGIVVRPLTARHPRLRKEMAKSLRKARESSGLTVAEVQRRVGVSRMTWWNWENGKTAVPAEFVPGIADILSTTVTALLEIERAARRAA